ncbi:hypothetical protein ABTM71_19730, partial [Acinetobacter baumannii]
VISEESNARLFSIMLPVMVPILHIQIIDDRRLRGRPARFQRVRSLQRTTPRRPGRACPGDDDRARKKIARVGLFASLRAKRSNPS